MLITDLHAVDFDISLAGFDLPGPDDFSEGTLQYKVHDEFDVSAGLQNTAATKTEGIGATGRHRLIRSDGAKGQTYHFSNERRESGLGRASGGVVRSSACSG